MDLLPPKNLGLDLVRVTESAALSAGRYMGLGRVQAPDEAAARAMRRALRNLDIDGHIVLSEDDRLGHRTPVDAGRKVGTGIGPAVDVIVDAIDGRRLVAKGAGGALSAIGVAPRGTLWAPKPAAYMEKLVVDHSAAEVLVDECMDAPAGWTLALVARAKKKSLRDLVVFVLDRPRHEDLISEIREAGARVMRADEGDIAGAIMAARGASPVDVMMGVGGVLEGVLAACAVRSLGGQMLGRLAPQSDEERALLEEAGHDVSKIYTCNDIVRSEEAFFVATGVTDGPLLGGVQYHGHYASSESLFLRIETGTRRFIHTEHTVFPDPTRRAETVEIAPMAEGSDGNQSADRVK